MRLPVESLVEVPLHVLARQEPAWKSGDIGQLTPARMACIPSDGEAPSLYRAAETLTGFAEMYGGAGVGANAGGVRCANLEGCQVKGVGSTILAGRTTDKWHKHGACSLQDAIKEAIFSELFHVALPHGAARPIAVYDLGVTFATEIGVDKLPGKAPRALFVREPIVRLAHFMRSSFVDVSGEIAARELPRMRLLVPMLVDHICARKGKPCFDTAEMGLQELYWRILEQTIAMRLKRMVHGSMIPSNFGIDGRLVDFTTATAVSTLQPVVVSLGSACSQTQHQQVLDTVADMVFYLSKFDPRCRSDRHQVKRTVRHIIDELTKRYESAVMHGHLQLIGLSDQELEATSPDCRDRLARAIVRIILQGSTEGHLYYGGDEHPMLPVMGKNDLCGALLGAIVRRGCQNDLIKIGVAETCAAFTRTSISELFDAYDQACLQLQGSGLNGANMRSSHLLRAMKINADLSGLYRRRIDGRINDLCVNGGQIAAFIETTLTQWRNLLRTSPSGDVLLNGWLTRDDYRLSALNELTLNGRPAEFTPMFSESYETPLSQRYVWLKHSLAQVPTISL